MIAFLAAQPAGTQDQILSALQSEAVHMAVILHLDFAETPLRLSNRNLPFKDLRWGHQWAAGSGLLVGLPEIGGGDGELAPFREYRLGMPNEWIDAENWRGALVEMVSNAAAFRGRDAGLYGQLFQSDGDQPIGYPFAFDIGFMDRMTVSFPRGGAIVSLTTESNLARKGAPVYGMQTYFDQKRRYPTDEGLQFVTEADKLIEWTNW